MQPLQGCQRCVEIGEIADVGQKHSERVKSGKESWQSARQQRVSGYVQLFQVEAGRDSLRDECEVARSASAIGFVRPVVLGFLLPYTYDRSRTTRVAARAGEYAVRMLLSSTG